MAISEIYEYRTHDDYITVLSLQKERIVDKYKDRLVHCLIDRRAICDDVIDTDKFYIVTAESRFQARCILERVDALIRRNVDFSLSIAQVCFLEVPDLKETLLARVQNYYVVSGEKAETIKEVTAAELAIDSLAKRVATATTDEEHASTLIDYVTLVNREDVAFIDRSFYSDRVDPVLIKYYHRDIILSPEIPKSLERLTASICGNIANGIYSSVFGRKQFGGATYEINIEAAELVRKAGQSLHISIKSLSRGPAYCANIFGNKIGILIN